MNECIRTTGGTNLTEEDRSVGRITWPIATLSTERLVFLSETRRCHNIEDPNMVTHCRDTVKLCVVEEQQWSTFVSRGLNVKVIPQLAEVAQGVPGRLGPGFS